MTMNEKTRPCVRDNGGSSAQSEQVEQAYQYEQDQRVVDVDEKAGE